MGKQPYIPLYIGDWEQDTNMISLEAEGALLKLVFKLWKSDDKGLLEFCLPQIAILLRKSEKITKKILKELHENKILEIEFLGSDKVKIESRRMRKQSAISTVRSEIGKKGGAKNKEFCLSKTKAKVKQNADIDNDNVILFTTTNLNKAEEILKSDAWIEQIAMNESIALSAVKEKLAYFLNKQALVDGYFEKDLKDIKSHFLNWLPKNKPSGGQAGRMVY